MPGRQIGRERQPLAGIELPVKDGDALHYSLRQGLSHARLQVVGEGEYSRNSSAAKASRHGVHCEPRGSGSPQNSH
jgi:hypothetical protein